MTPIALVLVAIFSIGLNVWLVLFIVVLLHDHAQLAPRRSGGGSPSSRKCSAPPPTSTILTPRKIQRPDR